MKRKILVTSVVLAAGLVILLAYDSGAGEMLANTLWYLDFHVSKFIPSVLSLLTVEEVGIILMVIVGTAATIFFHGRDADKG